MTPATWSLTVRAITRSPCRARAVCGAVLNRIVLVIPRVVITVTLLSAMPTTAPASARAVRGRRIVKTPCP